jgi:putative ABC transport system ATP-binding protein
MGRRHSSSKIAAVAEAAVGSGHPALRLEGVGRTYGSGPTTVDALKDVGLEVWPGEFVVLLGPSGSGKTTLLNLVGGIEKPTCGRILVSGKDIATLNARERTAYRRDQVGFVFQFFNLVASLTALENVEIIAELAGNDFARRSPEALVKVGLADLADRFPAQMSGGQQQRVAIARAIVKEPPLLLCDEPTGSLDLATGRQVLALLREQAGEGRHTVLLVTHNSAIAEIADRVVWLHSGTVARHERVAAPVEAQDLDW